MIDSETQLYHQLLVDARHGNIDAVKGSFDKVRQLRAPKLDPLQSVAAIGAYSGYMSIVQFALDLGAEKDRGFCLAVKQGSIKRAEMAEYYEANKAEFDAIIIAPHPNAKPWKPPYPGFSITKL